MSQIEINTREELTQVQNNLEKYESIIISGDFSDSDIDISNLSSLKNLTINNIDWSGDIIISNNVNLEVLEISIVCAEKIVIENNRNLDNINFHLFLPEDFEQSLIYSCLPESLSIKGNNQNVTISLSESEKYYFFRNNSDFHFDITENTKEQLNEMVNMVEWNPCSHIDLNKVLKSIIDNKNIDKVTLCMIYDMYSGYEGSIGLKELYDEYNSWNEEHTAHYNFLCKIEQRIVNKKYSTITPKFYDDYPMRGWITDKRIPDYLREYAGYTYQELIQVVRENITKEIKKSEKSHFARKFDKVYFDKIEMDVDIDSFEIIDGFYSRDKNHVYCQNKKIEGINMQGLKIIDAKYGYCKDFKNIYWLDKKLDDLDINSFEIIDAHAGVCKDKHKVSFWGYLIDGVDAESFEVINGDDGYSKDKNNVYYELNRVMGANVNTFSKMMDEGDFKLPIYGDNEKIYKKGEILNY